MDNITFITSENPDKTTTEHVIIDRGNNEFTSMSKEDYDALIQVSIQINEGAN